LSKIAGVGRVLRDLARKDVRRNLWRALLAYRLAPDYDCPCCSYRGRFVFAGDTLHPNAECPSCRAMHRHRLLAFAAQAGFVSFAGKSVLHFAPEPAVARLVRAHGPAEYRTADLRKGAAERVANIEAMDDPDSSVDTIICSHVLEHVDDRAALREIHRILRPGGEAILMVPIVEAWEQSFEDDSIRDPAERHRYFNQWDHVRCYGRDFRDRVEGAGFDLLEFRADGRQCARMGLMRGETVFRAVRRP